VGGARQQGLTTIFSVTEKEEQRMDYSQYQHLLIEKKDGIALLTINRPESLNSTNFRLHNELSRVWLDIAEDDQVRVALITGAGRAFSAGGDFEVVERSMGNLEVVAQTMKEARDIVHNMINCDKPIISAINGVAVGAGLAVALLADISIASENARFTDGHTRLGVAAGDHAAVIWPLLVGMAKAKYYLLTCDMLDAKEAERIGLVSMVVPHDQLMPKAMEVARKLATGAQQAIRWTKHSLNQWLRAAAHTSFDYSLALEMLGFFGPDVGEGLAALKERRPASFPSAQEKK
jgi:enoyl-CoA hydratase